MPLIEPKIKKRKLEGKAKKINTIAEMGMNWKTRKYLFVKLKTQQLKINRHFVPLLRKSCYELKCKKRIHISELRRKPRTDGKRMEGQIN